jgi:hypothetical protein
VTCETQTQYPVKALGDLNKKVIAFTAFLYLRKYLTIGLISVADPDPHVFGPPGSGSRSFCHHAKTVRKTLIPSILWLFLNFYLWKMM